MRPCGQRLSRLWLLPIIKRKKRMHPRPWRKREAGRCQSISGNAVAESDNIVAETAEKIFADLADAQTINRDTKGEWKAPLWQAATEAGAPPAPAALLSRCRSQRRCWQAGCWRKPGSPRPMAR